MNRGAVLVALLALVLLLGATPSRANYIVEVAPGKVGAADAVFLRINGYDVCAFKDTNSSRVLLTRIAETLNRDVRNKPETSGVPAVLVKDPALVLAFPNKREFSFALNDLLLPKAEKKSIPAAIAERFKQGFREPLLSANPAKLTIPLGERRTAKLAGASLEGVEALNAYPQRVDAVVTAREVSVLGLAEGEGEIVLRTPFAEIKLPFEVRKLAAYFPESLLLEFAGGFPHDGELEQAVQAQVLGASAIGPGASVRFEGLTLKGGGRAWGQASYEAKVVAEAPQRIKAVRTIPVSMAVRGPFTSGAQTVLFSNSPEQVFGPGLLFRSNVLSSESARLVYHHQNRTGKKLRFRVALTNLTGYPQQVFWRAGNARPNISTYLVGVDSAETYLKKLLDGEGIYLTLAPHAKANLFSAVALPDYSVSGLIELHLLDHGEVSVSVVAEDAGGQELDEMRYAAQNPPRYAPAVVELSDTYDLDGAWLFLRVGKGLMQDLSAGRALVGDYGLVLDYTVTLMNSEALTRRVALMFDATAGEARGVFVVNGKIVRTPSVFPRNPHELEVFRLGPYEKRTVRVMTIPASGSHFPANIVFHSLD